MLKKNNRTKNSSSTRLCAVHRFKPKNETKKVKINSKIYTEFLFLSLFWVVKMEKLIYYSKAIYLYCKIILAEYPKMLQVELQRKSTTHCPMSRPQVDVATWTSLDGS